MSASAPLDPRLRAWRWRVFSATWLAYFGYYFCRKPFYIAKSDLMEAHHWSSQDLGNIGAVYLITYAIGQFIAGWSSNRWGARVVLLCGMTVTLAVNAAFGITDSKATFALLMGLNGLVQATGWSSCVGTMGQWFHRGERASVMGPWATNFQLGSIMAGLFSAWLLGRAGYQWSFFGGSLVMLVVLAFFAFNQRNRPEDLGLPPVKDPRETPAEAAEAASTDDSMARAVWLNIGLVGIFYFFAKLIRYALWSWVPLMLNQHYGMSKADAGYLSTVFDAAGFAGTFAAGFLADRLFRGSLASLSFVFIAAMTASMGFLYVGGTASLALFGIGLALVGFFLYGPDALMTGAGAVNVGSPRHAAKAAGFISGIGSLGPIIQELVLPRYMGSGDVTQVFGLLLVSAVLCLAALGWMLRRNRTGLAAL